MFRGRANFFPTGTTPHTNPINTQGPEEVVDVSAINNSFVCWICQKPGHVFRDCTSSQRGFFCFKCGKPNTTDPKCENCRSANARKNVVIAGNQHSSEQPAGVRTLISQLGAMKK